MSKQPVSTTHYAEIVRGADKVVVLTMDSAPVNSLSKGTRAGLVAGVERALKDKAVTGVIIRGAGRAFCAGAEITEFAGDSTNIKEEPLTSTIERFENSSIPSLALVHGFALGGGMEVSLGCHYRVATEDAMFGLPEVNLGLLPGAGGTQRLPRLIGAVPACELILSGNHITAGQANKLGVVDLVVSKKLTEEERLNAAVEFLLKNKKVRPVSQLAIPDAKQEGLMGKLDQVLKAASAKRRGEIAPINITEAVKQAVITYPDFKAGMHMENVLFTELLKSSEARALQHIFFAERAAAKLDKQYAAATPLKLKNIGIIGAGLMGGGIAMSCAENGLNVVLIDAKQEFLERGLEVIKGNYKRSVEKKSMSQKRMDEVMGRIKGTLNYDELKSVDLVVEAVFEDIKLKKSIFQNLDKVCKPGCILATNTSGLDIDEIANATSRPQDVVGCHFFSPANVMRLLENVKGAKSSPVAISTVMDFGKRIGKVAILVGNCPGFVGNRMLGPYQKEAEKMILEGIPFERVDGVAKNLIGMNMGPIAMADLVGLELFWRKRKTLGQSNANTIVDDALCEAGRYGQKNNKGYYKYEKGSREPVVDPEAVAIVQKVAKNLGIRPRVKVTDQEIMERLLFPLINEGFKCLEEGMAAKMSDVDVCYAFGYGFPKWRGGPMKFAEEIGFDSVLAGLKKYQRLGHKDKYWVPAQLLQTKVTEAAHKEAKKAKL